MTIFGRKLYVGNLDYACTEAELQTFCQQWGGVIQVFIPKDAEGRGRGFAFVTFDSEVVAGLALDALCRSDFQGRALNANWARPRISGTPRT